MWSPVLYCYYSTSPLSSTDTLCTRVIPSVHIIMRKLSYLSLNIIKMMKLCKMRNIEASPPTYTNNTPTQAQLGAGWPQWWSAPWS